MTLRINIDDTSVVPKPHLLALAKLLIEIGGGASTAGFIVQGEQVFIDNVASLAPIADSATPSAAVVFGGHPAPLPPAAGAELLPPPVNPAQVTPSATGAGGTLPPAITPPAAGQSGGPVLDSQGVPWDAAIHASSKGFVQDGTWRKKKGVDATFHAQRTAELKLLAQATPNTPPPANVAPVNPAPAAPAGALPPAASFPTEANLPTITSAPELFSLIGDWQKDKDATGNPVHLSQASITEACKEVGLADLTAVFSAPASFFQPLAVALARKLV